MATAIEFDEVNADLWDGWSVLNATSHAEGYDVEDFRKGGITLKAIEREALGDIAGKRVLHLQCHFGLDTLSLARLGAVVTGVDYSPKCIEYARSLSDELGIPATFVCSNVYDLPDVPSEKFDVVFTSYGVLHWLPDLKRWATIVASHLAEGGIFYMVEFHPFFNMFDEKGTDITFPYFPAPPVRSIKQGPCGRPDADFEHVAYEWPHSMSEIMMALLDAGLRITRFEEYPFIVFNRLPYLEEVKEGVYAPVRWKHPIPMMFSIKASPMSVQ